MTLRLRYRGLAASLAPGLPIRSTAARHLKRFAALLGIGALMVSASWVDADTVGPESRRKASFIVNFISFTEWPQASGGSLALCIYGDDPFGDEIDAIAGRLIGGRRITLQREAAGQSLKGCDVAFLAGSTIADWPRLLAELRGSPVLTVADSPGALDRGVVLNMITKQNKLTFEASLPSARRHGLKLSSQLLRLAAAVRR